MDDIGRRGHAGELPEQTGEMARRGVDLAGDLRHRERVDQVVMDIAHGKPGRPVPHRGLDPFRLWVGGRSGPDLRNGQQQRRDLCAHLYFVPRQRTASGRTRTACHCAARRARIGSGDDRPDGEVLQEPPHPVSLWECSGRPLETDPGQFHVRRVCVDDLMHDAGPRDKDSPRRPDAPAFTRNRPAPCAPTWQTSKNVCRCGLLSGRCSRASPLQQFHRPLPQRDPPRPRFSRSVQSI